MIECTNLSKRFGDKVILSGWSHTFPETGIVAVTGPSGRGKTTLLRMIAGLDKDYEGQIRLSGVGSMSMVFQENRLLPTLTALQNVDLVSKDTGKAEKILSRLGLSDDLGTYPGELSGGMKRRVAFARAFAKDADLYILDEPFVSVDEDTKKELLDIVREAGAKSLVLLVTHDEQDITDLGAERVLLTDPEDTSRKEGKTD